jgi:branched-chain amino acid transport system permease protein
LSDFLQYLILGITRGSMYALIALGYTLVYGVLQLINFAHSEVFMFGAFGGLFGARWLLGGSGLPSGLESVGLVVFGLGCGALAGAVAAFLLERTAYRPLRKRGSSKLAALISAIGASLFLQEAFALRWHGGGLDESGRDYVNVDRVMSKDTLFSIGSGVVRSDKLLVFLAAIVMMVALDRFVNGTKLGRGIRATAQDSESAVLMGVDIDRIIVVTFLLGGAMAGLAGALYVVYFEHTQNLIGFVLGIKAFTAAVLGGIGNLRGALLGGLLLGVAENYGAAVFGTEWKDVVAFVLLILILLVRPSGLLGESLGKARA